MMQVEQARELQRLMQRAGYYGGDDDGDWGDLSQAGAVAALSSLPQVVAPPPPEIAPSAAPTRLAWGARVSQTFRDRVLWIGEQLGLDPSDLMSCMAWESGRSFRADVRNMAGSGATGLIQFMPSTARGMGTTTDALAAMTPEDQLKFVYRYFEPFRGKLNSLDDIYMAILWPAAVGKPASHALFTGGVAYRQNAGLDIDRDGVVTKAEAARKVRGLLDEGLRPGNVWEAVA
jgi:hypothetical protein